jgi:hypothetical protein
MDNQNGAADDVYPSLHELFGRIRKYINDSMENEEQMSTLLSEQQISETKPCFAFGEARCM